MSFSGLVDGAQYIRDPRTETIILKVLYQPMDYFSENSEITPEMLLAEYLEDDSTQLATTHFVKYHYNLSSDKIEELRNNLNETANRLETEKADINLSNLTPAGLQLVVPTGVILLYGGTTAPNGYLICDGREVSRTDYANLFAVIGTAYGEGDGTTTFNIPNFIDRYPRGNDRGYSNQTLPNITGYFQGGGLWSGQYVGGVFADTGRRGDSKSYNAGSRKEFNEGGYDFNASRSNTAYGALNKNGQAGYVMPYTTHCYFIIKY